MSGNPPTWFAPDYDEDEIEYPDDALATVALEPALATTPARNTSQIGEG